MSKRESVVFQANSLLRESYHAGYGRSRHADKKNAMNNGKRVDEYTKDKIYSQKTYDATNKTCIAFVKHCREEFNVRYLDEIKPEMFNSFIQKGDFKTGQAYDHKTAATYASQVSKLQEAYNSRNNSELTFVNTSYKDYVVEVEQRKNMMPREVHDRIIERAYENKYENGLAFQTARSLGLRATEITNLRKEDFNYKENGQLDYVHIHRSKGGRSRDVEARQLTEQQINNINNTYDYFKNSCADHDRFFKNKSESYEKAFKSCRELVAPQQYTYCGIHSMRKEFAQDYYKREFEKGRDEKEVKTELTQMLGHNRLEVLQAYLGK